MRHKELECKEMWLLSKTKGRQRISIIIIIIAASLINTSSQKNKMETANKPIEKRKTSLWTTSKQQQQHFKKPNGIDFLCEECERFGSIECAHLLKILITRTKIRILDFITDSEKKNEISICWSNSEKKLHCKEDWRQSQWEKKKLFILPKGSPGEWRPKKKQHIDCVQHVQFFS